MLPIVTYCNYVLQYCYMLVIVIVSINLQLKFATVTLCNYWQHLERLNFSYTFAGNVYAEAEV